MKSIVFAALNELMFDSLEVTKVLIIAPLRVAKHTWSAEIQKGSSKGCLLSTEGNVIHYDFIEHFINELAEKYHILEIAVDR